jgi:hypothetical protein
MAGIGHNSGDFDQDDVENPYGRSGYIKVGRDLRWHHIVGFGKTVTPADDSKGFVFSRAEAWQDLIMECRYNAGTVLNKGVPMRIEPGQLLGAISWLANRWNWTPKTVRVFLDALERDGMIGRSVPVNPSPDQSAPYANRGNPMATTPAFKGNHVAMVTICNYELYQFIQRVQGQAKAQGADDPGQPAGNLVAATGHDLNKGNKEIIDSHTTSLAAPRESVPQSNVVQLSTLSIPATMREQLPALPLPRLLEAPPPAKKPRKPRSAKTMLPSQWTLPGTWLQWTLDRFDVRVEAIALEAERFKEYWLANGDEKADWEMTWRNWCRSGHRKWRPKHGAPSDIIDKNYAPLLEAEVVPVDPWAEQRAEAARRRAEEDGA